VLLKTLEEERARLSQKLQTNPTERDEQEFHRVQAVIDYYNQVSRKAQRVLKDRN
jgi:hypothetical protein